MNENQGVPIVFCIDYKMVMPLGVSITSLVMNAEGVFYDIYIVVDKTVSESDRMKLKGMEVFFKNQFTITFIEIGNVFDNKKISISHSYWSQANYYRLLLPQLLPQYDIVIYSDADIIFQSSLKDIYKPLGNNLLAASQDNMQNVKIQQRAKKLGLEDGQCYFCAGFLVMNLQKFRDEDLVTESLELAGSQRFEFMDQDILNFLCKGRVVYLSPFVCRYSIYASPKTPMEKRLLLTEENIFHSLNKCAIHYIGKEKPWNSFCHRWEVWWHYYMYSPFFDSGFYYQRQHDLANGDYLSFYRRFKLLIRYFVGKDSCIRRLFKKVFGAKRK